MGEGARRIWVTRASPGAEATAERLLGLGFEPLVDPLLEVRDLSPIVDLDGVAALAFTSVNGVTAFARLHSGRNLKVFAVGDRTAQAAREVGFERVDSADGDVAALSELIVGRAGPLAGAVLHPSAAEPAGDLASPLIAAGLSVRRLSVYETVIRAPATKTLEGLDRLEAVLLHSPRAARALSALLADRAAPGLRVLCLSQAVAAPLATLASTGVLASVAFAPHPTETALLGLLTV